MLLLLIVMIVSISSASAGTYRNLDERRIHEVSEFSLFFGSCSITKERNQLTCFSVTVNIVDYTAYFSRWTTFSCYYADVIPFVLIAS